MIVSRIIIAVATLLLWSMFAITEWSWTGILMRAVHDQTGTYGEMYGPVSFLRIPLFWLASLGTVLCATLACVPAKRSA